MLRDYAKRFTRKFLDELETQMASIDLRKIRMRPGAAVTRALIGPILVASYRAVKASRGHDELPAGAIGVQRWLEGHVGLYSTRGPETLGSKHPD